MLLGVFLIGVAVYLFRWFARSPDGSRHGFTAMRTSGKQKHSLSTASSVFGLVSPASFVPTPQSQSPSLDSAGFGGSSGGAGASGDF